MQLPTDEFLLIVFTSLLLPPLLLQRLNPLHTLRISITTLPLGPLLEHRGDPLSLTADLGRALE